jgi:hypothetical protein
MATKKKRTTTNSTPKPGIFSKAKVEAAILARARSPLKLRDWIDRYFPFIVGPRITYFDPTSGPPGTLVTIHGSDFSVVRDENSVSVGGQAAYVASASSTELKVITASNVENGPVKMTVGAHTAAGPQAIRMRVPVRMVHRFYSKAPGKGLKATLTRSARSGSWLPW